MTWNWEQLDWPDFTYDSGALDPLEKQFLLQSGEFIGVCKHIGAGGIDAADRTAEGLWWHEQGRARDGDLERARGVLPQERRLVRD